MVGGQLVLGPHEARRAVAEVDRGDVVADGAAGRAVQPAELCRRWQPSEPSVACVERLGARTVSLDRAPPAPALRDVGFRVLDGSHVGTSPVWSSRDGALPGARLAACVSLGASPSHEWLLPAQWRQKRTNPQPTATSARWCETRTIGKHRWCRRDAWKIVSATRPVAIAHSEGIRDDRTVDRARNHRRSRTWLIALYNGLIRAQEPGRGGVERHRRAAQAPLRADPQPRRTP